MNIKSLKEVIKNLPDNTQVFVACEGYCNFDLKNNEPWEDTDTFAIVYDGKLFITDSSAVEIDNEGNTL